MAWSSGVPFYCILEAVVLFPICLCFVKIGVIMANWGGLVQFLYTLRLGLFPHWSSGHTNISLALSYPLLLLDCSCWLAPCACFHAFSFAGLFAAPSNTVLLSVSISLSVIFQISYCTYH
ncbi:hypothetical protein K469DRAFT_73415 [Zopfia rhizophila CBS 207.26]|uniref:Uncharacterized protein n=1 Tax=Zopfia rhizophila CBS 207.26 TaxID=1314779 RepID=A0A6A6EAE8_9PEZI|nr:hypothetical protein K469DRAFT_73415 [Zopfia rhizophila CBS 207.26]